MQSCQHFGYDRERPYKLQQEAVFFFHGEVFTQIVKAARAFISEVRDTTNPSLVFRRWVRNVPITCRAMFSDRALV